MLQIDVLTIFPGLFDPFLRTAFVGNGQRQEKLRIEVHDIRAWTQDRHRTVDDTPYGGGPGMVMKPEPLFDAIEGVAGEKEERKARVILMTPRGRKLDQPYLEELAKEEHLLLVCSRYEGVDQRVIDLAVDEEVSIGDYVVSGGEVPAMVIIEGIARLIPGVLGNPDSVNQESFQENLLEAHHYTRPEEFQGQTVPDVLRSGDHAAIERWRAEKANEITQKRRPDLIEAALRGEKR